MSDPSYDERHLRHAHAVATRRLRESESLATPIPTSHDVRVALSRELGLAMPLARVVRLCQLAGLPLSDAPAETWHGRRPRRG